MYNIARQWIITHNINLHEYSIIYIIQQYWLLQSPIYIPHGLSLAMCEILAWSNASPLNINNDTYFGIQS